MTESNREEAFDDLFRRLEKAIGKPLDILFDSLRDGACEKEVMEDFLMKTFEEKKKKVASELSQTEIAVVMLLSGYLIEPKLKDRSTFEIVNSLGHVEGVEAFAADMRANGLEVTFDQVAIAITNVISHIMQFGLASLHHGLMVGDVDCSPPRTRDKNFEDLGIEDPFKDSPES